VLQATRLTLVKFDVRPRGFASPPLDGFAFFSSAARTNNIGVGDIDLRNFRSRLPFPPV
jgi:hypothetical protein